MRMRLTAVLVLFALALAGSACWAEERPAMDIPLYPGGEATMEINLSNEDILPMIKAMLPMLGDKFAGITGAASPDDIGDIFKNVQRIQLLQVDVTKPGAAEKDVAGFYAKNLPKSGSWSRVFWQSGSSAGTIAVYSQPGAEQLYAFRVRSVKADGKTIERAEIVKTEGQIDYVKLISLASRFVAAAKPAPQPTPQPAAPPTN